MSDRALANKPARKGMCAGRGQVSNSRPPPETLGHFLALGYADAVSGTYVFLAELETEM